MKEKNFQRGLVRIPYPHCNLKIKASSHDLHFDPGDGMHFTSSPSSLLSSSLFVALSPLKVVKSHVDVVNRDRFFDMTWVKVGDAISRIESSSVATLSRSDLIFVVMRRLREKDLERKELHYGIEYSGGWNTERVGIPMVAFCSVYQWCSILNKMADIWPKTIGNQNKMAAILFRFSHSQDTVANTVVLSLLP